MNSEEKDLCRSCAANKGYSKSKDQRRHEQFAKLYEACKKNGYTIITDESEYVNCNMNIEFICPKHGKQIMKMYNLQSGHKCRICSYEERANKCKHTPDYVASVVAMFNDNKLLNKEDYISSHTRNLKIQCGKCNGVHTYIVSFDDYVGNKQHQCHSCSSYESSGEKIIADYLTSLRIDFIREKKFADCKDKRQLPFDFYLPKYNLIIEFDGPHHFKKVWNEKHLKYTQKHDKIKNDYCMAHGIHLLRISYLDGHNVSQLIDNKLNEILQVKDIV